jgi:beta-phosphoglucomutase
MMRWIQNYQLFLFDFDGLLVDTEPLHYAAYMEMSRQRGCPLQWDFKQFCTEAHGKAMGFFDGMQREYPDVFKTGPSMHQLYEEKKRIYNALLHTMPLQMMEGAEALIEALDASQIKRAVVTNSPRAQIELIKMKIPTLQKIPLWVTREDYAKPKPSPEGYLLAIETLKRPGDRVIGFEDTLKGLKALVASGAEAVLVCSKDQDHEVEGRSLGAKHFEKLSSIVDLH